MQYLKDSLQIESVMWLMSQHQTFFKEIWKLFSQQLVNPSLSDYVSSFNSYKLIHNHAISQSLSHSKYIIGSIFKKLTSNTNFCWQFQIPIYQWERKEEKKMEDILFAIDCLLRIWDRDNDSNFLSKLCSFVHLHFYIVQNN